MQEASTTKTTNEARQEIFNQLEEQIRMEYGEKADWKMISVLSVGKYFIPIERNGKTQYWKPKSNIFTLFEKAKA